MTAINEISRLGVKPGEDTQGLKISNARVNKSNAAAFDGCFSGMHKPEDFAVHPLSLLEARVTIQSETRIGWITAKGDVYLSPVISSGAHLPHLSLSVLVDKMNAEEMFHLVTCVSCVYALKVGSRTSANVLSPPLVNENKTAVSIPGGDRKKKK